MDIISKVILDLCGGTGAWSKPYVEADYDVRLITLPEYDVTKIYCDRAGLCLPKIGGSMEVLSYSGIHGILAAPPCTEFSFAKGAAVRDFASAMETVEACLKIIWHCRIYGKPKFWAMENPRGYLRQFLGKPPFTFEQWQFGDDGIKATDIWGYYAVPKVKYTEVPEGLLTKYPKGGRTQSRMFSIPKVPDWCKDMNLNRAALRAITPPGFAQAFYRANK